VKRAEGGGLREIAADLRALVPGFDRRAAMIGALAFVGGLLEAGMLVTLTLIAEATVRGDDVVQFAGTELSRPEAVGVGLGLLAGRIGLAVASSWLAVTTAASAMHRTRVELMRRFLTSRPDRLGAQRLGAMQERVTTWCDRVAAATESAGALISSLLSFLALLCVAVSVDPVVFLLAAAAAVLLGVVLRPISTAVRHNAERNRVTSFEFAGSISESVLVAPELSAYGVAARRTQEIELTSGHAAAAWRRARLSTMALPWTFQAVAYSFVFVGLLVADLGEGDVARWGAVLLILLRSLSSGQQVTVYRGQLLDHQPFVRGAADELERLAADRNPPGSRTVEHAAPVVLEAVGFAYGEELVLEGVSLVIPPGALVALVGPSGAGKSTLARLVLRQALPTTGTLLIDGVPIETVRADVWSRLVAHVAQQPVMVTGSIRDNVRLYRDIGDAEIRDACARANVLDEIEALPDGFETVIAPTSGALSVGQRQRLAIARALAASPQLIVLDEPTSALDVKSEQRIAATLEALRGSTTVLVIAHRYATVARSDLVIALNKGRVEATGDVDGVLRRSAFFRSMHSAEGSRDPRTEATGARE
jgi:ATP-binding cassette subfamily B protein